MGHSTKKCTIAGFRGFSGVAAHTIYNIHPKMVAMMSIERKHFMLREYV